MARVGIVFDATMTRHYNLGEPHPECPQRILRIYGELLNQGLIDRTLAVPSRSATKNEIRKVHGREYCDRIFNSTCKQLGNYNSLYANPETVDVALRAAGSAIELVDHIVSGAIDSGFAVIRPPGHHAGAKGKPGGFCIFNNVMMAAVASGKRVAIVDWDIHHGDGTEDLVKAGRYSNEIFFASIHRSDDGQYYPGTGLSQTDNILTDHILNVPLNCSGAESEVVFCTQFEGTILPRLREFKPELILVSAGFDAAESDPLGGYRLQPAHYAQFTRQLCEICPKIGLFLEGGYSLTAIPKCVAACVEELLKV